MAENNPYLLWPGVDDRAVVEAMQQSNTSRHWNECYELVRKLVQIRAKNIPPDQWEDIVQDAMLRTRNSLSTFQFQCRLKNWIFSIVRTTVIDAYRRHKRIDQFITSLDAHREDAENDSDTPHIPLAPKTVEDQCLINYELAEALANIEEYLSKHANVKRNRRIVELVFFENRSLEEVAKAVGCSPPVAGYVIRSIQRYLREKGYSDF